tara:strand:- start:214 stop:324 length:111 start_codon:yes stop_codon:yes gene_type:complete
MRSKKKSKVEKVKKPASSKINKLNDEKLKPKIIFDL